VAGFISYILLPTCERVAAMQRAAASAQQGFDAAADAREAQKALLTLIHALATADMLGVLIDASA
jgi:hypothetical protein